MTHDSTIRLFEEDDAGDVSRLIVDNLLSVNILHYGEPVVRQLARSYSPELMKQYAQNGQMYVAVERSMVVGVAALEQNRVRNVFVRVDHHRQGIGGMLMEYIEEVACQQGRTRLFLLADLSAANFYQRLGYVRVEEKEETVGDARIRMVRMEKAL